MPLPFVTALCLTMPSRAEWLAEAVECFLAQGYGGETEMVIVSDEHMASPHASVPVVVAPGCVGLKRNAGCEFAAGQIIVHFDDDDYSAPGRLTDQVSRLLETGKAVTGYRDMKFTDGERWWLYQGTPDFVLGTSLAFRREHWAAHPFREMQIGQDEIFAREAWNNGQLAVAPDMGLMHATIHPGNTSPRNLAGSNWIPL